MSISINQEMRYEGDEAFRVIFIGPMRAVVMFFLHFRSLAFFAMVSACAFAPVLFDDL